MIYPAELSVRKNQKMLIDVLVILKDYIPKLKLLLPGLPTLLHECCQYAEESGVKEYVEFMGYQKDIPALLALSDIAVSSSRQEGLPVNLIEAMAMRKPIVATDIRGHRDLIDSGKNGCLVELDDSAEMAKKILDLYRDRELAKRMGEYGGGRAPDFSVDKVNCELKAIYESFGCRFCEDG